MKDDGGDDEADDGIGKLEAERDDSRRCENAQADEAVNSCVVAVSNESGAVQATTSAETHLRCNLVSDEADDACGREKPKVREAPRMDEAFNGLAKGDESTDENGEHDSETTPALAASAPQVEGDTERDGCERITEVMDEVSQESDAQRALVDKRLHQRRSREDGEADRYCADAGA